eukprot:TRINITY_DN11589_c0_g1_i3.p1 TRINITY_DN11589_c0_g1~~TRINITY_DN11589_c0_g1_i3.p1  ORF type:complete len:420 (+),score=59.87 TRINITY_DN11589_c0_g1_i3:55-1314(+)
MESSANFEQTLKLLNFGTYPSQKLVQQARQAVHSNFAAKGIILNYLMTLSVPHRPTNFFVFLELIEESVRELCSKTTHVEEVVQVLFSLMKFLATSTITNCKLLLQEGSYSRRNVFRGLNILKMLFTSPFIYVLVNSLKIRHPDEWSRLRDQELHHLYEEIMSSTLEVKNCAISLWGSIETLENPYCVSVKDRLAPTCPTYWLKHVRSTDSKYLYFSLDLAVRQQIYGNDVMTIQETKDMFEWMKRQRGYEQDEFFYLLWVTCLHLANVIRAKDGVESPNLKLINSFMLSKVPCMLVLWLLQEPTPKKFGTKRVVNMVESSLVLLCQSRFRVLLDLSSDHQECSDMLQLIVLFRGFFSLSPELHKSKGHIVGWWCPREARCPFWVIRKIESNLSKFNPHCHFEHQGNGRPLHKDCHQSR